MIKRISLTALASLAATVPALAHLDPVAHGSFAAGFTHPVFGLDHILAMVAVGLWAALLGGRSVLLVPAGFVFAMLAGFGLALAGVGLPFVEPVILASVIVLGLLAAVAVRLPAAEGASRQPDRIVLDTYARVPAEAKVWQTGARRYWLTAAPAGTPGAVENLVIDRDADGRISLTHALATLAGVGINSVLVECGPRLAGSLLREGLVDELICYVAPDLLGDTARPLATLPGLERLEQRIALEFKDVRKVGRDLKITAVPVPREN